MLKRIFAFFLAITIFTVLLAGCSGKENPSIIVPSVKADTIGDEVVAANSQFAFDIFKAIYFGEDKGNLFTSPASISTALAMTMNGASGNTLDEMEKVLGFKGIQTAMINNGFAYIVDMLNRSTKGIDISLANSVWIREGFPVLDSFRKINTDYFAASIEELDFSSEGAADTINNWVKENTRGLIESIIDGEIHPATVMYLINTIYFKGDWKVQFDPDNTYAADFTMDNSTIGRVDMMTQKSDALYYNSGSYKMISLPYGEGGISMDLILPGEGTSMADFLNEFDLKEYKDALWKISKKSDIVVSIPKFKAEYETSLKDVLIGLGMKDAFGGVCDLTRINEGGNLFISDVRHKSYIDVNEEGTEAAAVTSVEIRLTAIMEPLEFIADRPFRYIIRDNETGTILFMGIFDTP